MTDPGAQETIDAIIQLADDIARTSPESADKALRIVKLLGGLAPTQADRSTIQDAIDAQAPGDLSDVQLRNTADAVVRTLRDDR